MKIETYLKNRKIFEERCEALKDKTDLGYVNLYDVNKGIRNFQTFLHIYYQDIKPSVSNIVYSIDKRKRFWVGLGYNNRKPALKINIWTGHGSLIDKMHPFQYYLLLNSIKIFG